MDLNQHLEKMWVDYCHLNPKAKNIFQLLQQKNKHVINDHIALRTYRHPWLGVDHLAEYYLSMGYVEKGSYEFTEKKLFAKHYEHKEPEQPKIFISELILENFSSQLQERVDNLIRSVPQEVYQREDVAMMGRPWMTAYETYQSLLKESEYAAWVAAFGFRPNHFTIFINALEQFEEVADLNDFIKANGYLLNSSGGEVKGSPQVYLEQSSTMAERIHVEFEEGTFEIPSCYYEFAKRYPLPNGDLYQGFVEKSADKIFESTNAL